MYIHTYGERTLSNPYLRVVVLVTLQITGVIALSSCMGKMFSKILYNRLEKYLDTNSIISKEQIGFKKGSRTSDHILTLKTIIDKGFKSSKKVCACFIDFKKAFDTINKEALFFTIFSNII